MSRHPAPAFDYCQFQRFVNNVGGNDEFPAYVFPSIRHHGERLIQYGFIHKQWEEEEPWPPLPGVYAISALQMEFDGKQYAAIGSEHILYVGSSQNIRARLYNNHPWYDRLIDRFSLNDRACFVRYKVTNNYLWEERSLIRNLRPLLNIHHRNG